MINNVVLTGRLTKEPELKFTQNGVAFMNFTLAVQRNYKTDAGQYESDFISCVAWKKTAEMISGYAHKGSMIGIEGSIQTRNYENQQGQRIYVTEVNARQFHFMESKKDSQNNQQANNNQSYQQGYAQGYQQQQPQQPQHNQPIASEINEDDLPF
ncbi:single-stranded DNA-binding protein [Ligilactobacillus saerimneri]